jgi:hypothetical protein
MLGHPTRQMSDIKNIQTIAPMLADDFIDFEESIFDTDKYSEFLRDRKSKLGLFTKYLVCKLHDSWVIETNLTDKQFSITLNDSSTHVFADAIVDRFSLSIDHDKLTFPLTLTFDSNLAITYNTVDDDGNLQVISPVKLDEYLYEQVTIADTDEIEVVFHFWQSHEERPGERIILIVSAKEFSLTENQDNAWQKIFGSQYDNYYNYFKQQFDSDRYVSDQHICSELIDELDKSTTR